MELTGWVLKDIYPSFDQKKQVLYVDDTVFIYQFQKNLISDIQILSLTIENENAISY